MSHPQPPQRQPTSPEVQRYVRTLHNTALAAIVICPILALLPPRKFDVYTIGLGGASLFSANFLIREQTGRSIWQNLSLARNAPLQHAPLEHNTVPPTEQANLRRELQNASQELQRFRNEKDGPVMEEIKNQRETWKIEREKEIQEDLEEGKGFGDMIMDQIWEVWNWGKTKDDDDED